MSAPVEKSPLPPLPSPLLYTHVTHKHTPRQHTRKNTLGRHGTNGKQTGNGCGPRTTQGTLRDTVTHFTVWAMSLNTLGLSDLADCSCKETFYHHNTQQSLMGSEHFAKATGTHWSSDRSSHSRGRPHRHTQGFKESGVSAPLSPFINL